MYKLRSKVLVYEGSGSWRFLALPQKQGEEIRKLFGKHAKAWGSIPVQVKIGNSEWKTSLFPDKKKGTYLLPLNSEVRKAEGIKDDDTVSFLISL